MSIQQLVMAVGGRLNDATGGTITYNGDYQIHTFTSSGTFTVTRAGISSAVVDVLVVAGGSDGYEGGYSENEDDPPGPDGDGGDGGGGGYGGQVVASSTLTLASFNLNTGYTVTVGSAGNNSSFAYQSGTLSASADYLLGGGGGAAGGSNGNAGTNGTTSSITGVSAVYGSSGGGGGGGAGAGVGSGGNGGTNAGSGGSGGSFGNPGNNGAAATGYGSGGGGGGGAGGDYSTLRSPGQGGAGYGGVVIVRFKYQNI